LSQLKPLVSILFGFFVVGAHSQDQHYRCGNEYRNDSQAASDPGCIALEMYNPAYIQARQAYFECRTAASKAPTELGVRVALQACDESPDGQLLAMFAKHPKLATTQPKKPEISAQERASLHDSMLSVLSANGRNKAPPVPSFQDTKSRLAYLNWQNAASEALKARIPEPQARKELLQTVWYESKRAGLDVSLVLAVIGAASNFQQSHVLPNGARGFMGINPIWATKIGDGNTETLFQLQANIRYGCTLLRHFLDSRQGNLYLTLTDYFDDNLAGHDKKAYRDSAFPDRVLEEKGRWAGIGH